MADDQVDTDAAERAQIRQRYLDARARVTAVDPTTWVAQRDHEVDIVREAAAARRRHAA